MKKFIKQIVTTLAMATLMLVPVLVATTAFAAAADIDGNLCKGANLSFGEPADPAACTPSGNAASGLDKIITNVVNIFSVVVGVVAVIMIIYGGFRYITSGGDSGNVTNAKNTILYALVGLVIVALAQFLVKFVLSKATGLTE